MTGKLAATVFALSLLASACGGGTLGEGEGAGDDDFTPLEAPTDFPGPEASEAECSAYFDFEPYRDSDCLTPFANIHARRQLLLLAGPGDFWIERFTRGLQRYSSLFGLTFFTRHLPGDVALDWVMDDDEAALKAHLEAMFPDVDFTAPTFEGTDEQYRAIVTEVSRYELRPMLDFVHVYGNQGDDVTLVVFLSALTRLEARGLDQGVKTDATIVGMGLSPGLIDTFISRGGAEAEYWSSLDLGDFTPMLFVNAGALTQLVLGVGIDPVVIDLTVAHEMGHTFGLVHVDTARNLMNPSFETPSDVDCGTVLDVDQLKQIRQAAASTASTVGAGLSGADPAARRQQAWSLLVDHLQGQRRLILFH